MNRQTETSQAQMSVVSIKEKRFEHQKIDEKRDDLIEYLANAYENRRARQVNEWDLIRKQTRGAHL